MRKTLLALPLLLAACATPFELCVADASKDMRVLDKLIAQTRENIARGYAIGTETYFETEEQVCGTLNDQPVYCEVPVARTREVPVAIDLAAEQAKLQSLLDRRARDSANMAAIIDQCRARYPDA